MAKVHEMLIKIGSFLDSKFGSNVQKVVSGAGSIASKYEKLNQSSQKIKSLDVKIKSFEKTKGQLEALDKRNGILTKQVQEYTKALEGVSEGSEEYKNLKSTLGILEKEQKKVLDSQKKLNIQGNVTSSELKEEGINTKNLSSEKVKLINKNKDLKEKMDKLTSSQEKNINKTRSQDGVFSKLTGSMKGLVMAGVGLFGVSAIKNYGDEAINIANEKIKAETDLQAMFQNTKGLHGDQTAIKNATKDLIDYANAIETVGVIGDETVIAGQAQLATFQLMPATIKKLSDGMVDMLAKNKGAKATTEDATNIGNLFGKVMTGNVGALSKYGVTMTEAQKKTLKMGTETQRAALLAKILQENFGGANKALGETDEGQIVRMKNEIEGIKEEFGRGLLPVQRQFFEIFKGQGPNISKVLNGGLDVAKKFFDLFKKMKPEKVFNALYDSGGLVIEKIGLILDKGMSFIDWIKKGSDGAVVFGGAITTIVTAIGLYTTAVKIHYGWTKLVAGAQVLWNTACSLSPMGIFISALVGLGIGLVYAYKHSEKFREIVHKLWGKFKDFGAYVVTIPEKIKGIWDGITTKTNEFKDKILKLIEPLKNAVDWVGKLFGGGKEKNFTITAKTITTGSMSEKKLGLFAKGGISNKPAIFGEAGPEMAIPLKKDERSKSLWLQTGNILGLFNTPNSKDIKEKKSLFSSQKISQINETIKKQTTQIVNKFEIKFEIKVEGNVDKKQGEETGKQIGKSAADEFMKKIKEYERGKERLSFE